MSAIWMGIKLKIGMWLGEMAIGVGLVLFVVALFVLWMTYIHFADKYTRWKKRRATNG